MKETSMVGLAIQWRDWQVAYLKITALIGIAFSIIGVAGLLFLRGMNWRPNDFPDILYISVGGFVGFYGLAFVLSSTYYLARATRTALR